MSKTKRTNYSSDNALQAITKRIKKLHGEGKTADEIATIVRRNQAHVNTVLAAAEKSKNCFDWDEAGDQFINGKQFEPSPKKVRQDNKEVVNYKPLQNPVYHGTQNRN